MQRVDHEEQQHLVLLVAGEVVEAGDEEPDDADEQVDRPERETEDLGNGAAAGVV